jgi:signal transduction histidine kinase
VLTGGGLPPAIRRVAERSIVPVALVDVPLTRFDATAEATAYCVFAKALSAVQKHAHASSIRVRATAVRHTLQLELAGGHGTRTTATIPKPAARSWLRTPWSSRC